MKYIVFCMFFLFLLPPAQSNPLLYTEAKESFDRVFCIQKMQETFEAYRQEAIRLGPIEQRYRLEQFQVKFIDSRPGVDGSMEINRSIIILDPKKLCSRAELERSIIIAHELGHVVATSLYPELAKDLIGNLRRVSAEEQESAADQAAVLFFPRDRQEQAFAFLDSLCKAGNTYQCHRAAAWRYGLGRIE